MKLVDTSCIALLLALAGCGGEPRAERDDADVSASGGATFASWPMPNSPGLGLPNEKDYEVTSQGDQEAVLDRVTGLVWQRRLGSETFDFEGAREYCASLASAEPDAWRVPGRIELVSLLELTRAEPAIDVAAFPDTPGDWFWTSSVSASDPLLAWYGYFYFGYPDWDDRSASMRVRCVSARSGAAAHAPRYVPTAEVARDELTRLTWQRAAPTDRVTFADADAYCAALVLGDFEDWRVPSMPELETLVDERRRGPAIDEATFPATPSEPFWTTSGWAGSSELAWYVSFDYGAALYDSTSSPYFVRCVR